MAVLTETATPEIREQPLVPKAPVAPPTVRLDPIAWPVFGRIISSSNQAVAPMTVLMPERIRVSHGVIQGPCIRRVEPVYPKIALSTRVQGVVLLKAVISKTGKVTELEAVSGHPILVPAAMGAVKQWRYRPHLLNGERVEVETNITVTFNIAG